MRLIFRQIRARRRIYWESDQHIAHYSVRARTHHAHVRNTGMLGLDIDRDGHDLAGREGLDRGIVVGELETLAE